MDHTSLIFFIEGFAVAFFGILATQNLYHSDNRLRRILGAVLLYWCVQHLVSVSFIADFVSDERIFSRALNAFDMTAEPTCCFLLFELCRPGWLTWRKVWLNELPFVVLGAAFAITGNSTVYYVLVALFVAYGVMVFVLTLYYIPRYNKTLKQYYSYDENVNLNWLYAALSTLFALMLVYAVCGSYDTVVGDTVYLVGSIISWGMICYFIQRQETVIYELRASSAEQAEDPLQEAKPQPDLPDLAELIQRRFVETEMYLNPQLKLGEMATAIGTNRTYLSRYLNDTLNTTFYDYVNSLRLEYACKLIKEEQYSIKAVAVISGFNSYSTFRRSFIARYGMPPSNFRN